MGKRLPGGWLLLTASLIALVAYGATKVQDYNRYEAYLSQEMLSRVSVLAMAVFDNEKLLTDAATGKRLSQQQMMSLEENFIDIMNHAQEMDRLARSWERVEPGSIHNETSIASNDAYLFVYKLRVASGEEILLNEEQQQRVNRLQQQGLEWANVMRKDVPELNASAAAVRDLFYEQHREDGIKSAYWVQTIQDLQAASRDFPGK